MKKTYGQSSNKIEFKQGVLYQHERGCVVLCSQAGEELTGVVLDDPNKIYKDGQVTTFDGAEFSEFRRSITLTNL